MKKIGIPLGIVFIILLFIGIICIAIAAEVGVLLLVGIEFEHWKYLVGFIIIYGIIEFALVMLSDVLIELKSEQLHRFHQYFAHLLISFTLLMTISILMESIYLPMYGGIIFAITTATLYLLFDSGSKKERLQS
ncbi:histidine kinase [Solibacillus sp. A46]|uniref:Histidine kinase n=1 Tax=Solibacillus faecavium TaxID=2762221 RepID=A0ABR8Y0K9_9BACL|nr:histidine kinase [Solibacillus faecavium]MBD8037614.1 histidine kinase [Solibacillus faecavium]